MFRDDYKACFDDIKGDKALLEKVLKNKETAQRKTNVIKMHRNVISAAAAVFVLAMAGFMYNMGMFDGFLPSDNNEIIVTEKTENAENIQEKNVKEEKTEEKASVGGGETVLKPAKEEYTENVAATDATAKTETEKSESQTETVNDGIFTASVDEDVDENMAARMIVAEPTEYKGLTVFKEGIEQLTEKYDEAEKKYSYTDFEETKKVEITYYNEMPVFADENAGGDILRYIGETEDGYVKITAYGITEEYMSEIIESL